MKSLLKDINIVDNPYTNIFSLFFSVSPAISLFYPSTLNLSVISAFRSLFAHSFQLLTFYLRSIKLFKMSDPLSAWDKYNPIKAKLWKTPQVVYIRSLATINLLS